MKKLKKDALIDKKRLMDKNIEQEKVMHKKVNSNAMHNLSKNKAPKVKSLGISKAKKSRHHLNDTLKKKFHNNPYYHNSHKIAGLSKVSKKLDSLKRASQKKNLHLKKKHGNIHFKKLLRSMHPKKNLKVSEKSKSVLTLQMKENAEKKKIELAEKKLKKNNHY